MVNGWPILGDGALGGHPLSGHSRSAGMYGFNHWIPAFAGMTKGVRLVFFREWQRGCRDGDKLILTFGVIPAQAGIQGGGARW